jgi:hypothetical protein
MQANKIQPYNNKHQMIKHKKILHKQHQAKIQLIHNFRIKIITFKKEKVFN